jgi:hypothetical protein
MSETMLELVGFLSWIGIVGFIAILLAFVDGARRNWRGHHDDDV